MTGWDIYGRDLIALIEHLADKHGRKIWLGGHSMGGFTSVLPLPSGLIWSPDWCWPIRSFPHVGPIMHMIARLTGAMAACNWPKWLPKARHLA